MAEAIVLEWILPGETTGTVAGVAGPRGINSWGGIEGDLSDQADLAAALDSKQPADADLTALAGLAPANDALVQRKAGAWSARSPAEVKADLALSKADVGLGAVENAALSTWSGSANLTVLGTVGSGTWEGEAVTPGHGGTGQTGYLAGDILYASDADSLDRLPAAGSGNVLLSGAAPAWGKADLGDHVTGTLPVASGGTGQTTAGAALGALLPSQSGAAGKVLTSDGTSPAWQTPAPPAWGAITGTLSAQTDLQTALNGRLALGGGTLTGALGLPAGATGAPSLSASGDPNTGLWFPAPDTLAASVGGMEAWRVDSSARVGVGMTSLSAQFSVQSGSPGRVAVSVRGSAGQSSSLTEWANSSGALLASIDAAGHMALNKAAPNSSVILNIAGGNNERVDTVGNAYGIQVQVINQLSGNIRGILAQAESRYSGAGVSLVAFQTACAINSGGVSAANLIIGFHATTPTLNSSATLANAYGVYIDAQSGTGVGAGWAIYAPGGNDNSYFANNLLIGINSIPSSLRNGLVIGNTVSPPAGNVSGGSIYVESGALKYRGSTGTITVIAPP